ncbi:hypothetical protein MNBD_GAMMA02-196, partial [hydrothermal vent metagenome]
DSDAEDQNGVFYQDLTTDEFNLTQLEERLISKIQSTTLAMKGGS